MFGSKLLTTPLRMATKTVVYTAFPIAGPIKALTVGTRASSQRSKKGLKEAQKQTALLQAALDTINRGK